MNALPLPSSSFPPASLVGIPIDLGDMSLRQIYLALLCQSRDIMDEANDMPAGDRKPYRDKSVDLERKAADVAQFIARFGDMNVACFRRMRPLNLSVFGTNRLRPWGHSPYQCGARWIRQFIRTYEPASTPPALSTPPASKSGTERC